MIVTPMGTCSASCLSCYLAMVQCALILTTRSPTPLSSQFSGTDTFAYTIGDGRDGTDTGTVTVTVLPVQRRLATPSRSTTIALTSDDQRVVAVNRERHSLAIIEVRDTKSA